MASDNPSFWTIYVYFYIMMSIVIPNNAQNVVNDGQFTPVMPIRDG
jgi:hypothetical protein